MFMGLSDTIVVISTVDILALLYNILGSSVVCCLIKSLTYFW